MFKVKKIEKNDVSKLSGIISKCWGTGIIISKGKVYMLDDLEGYTLYVDERLVGVITYSIAANECEIVSIDALVRNNGVGKRMLQEVIKEVSARGCQVIRTVITNDRIDAIAFMQKNNFDMLKLHRYSVFEAKQLKPEIPINGEAGISILHELEFERIL